MHQPVKYEDYWGQVVKLVTYLTPEFPVTVLLRTARAHRNTQFGSVKTDILCTQAGRKASNQMLWALVKSEFQNQFFYVYMGWLHACKGKTRPIHARRDIFSAFPLFLKANQTPQVFIYRHTSNMAAYVLVECARLDNHVAHNCGQLQALTQQVLNTLYGSWIPGRTHANDVAHIAAEFSRQKWQQFNISVPCNSCEYLDGCLLFAVPFTPEIQSIQFSKR